MSRPKQNFRPEDQFSHEKTGAIVAGLIGLLLLVGIALIVSGLTS